MDLQAWLDQANTHLAHTIRRSGWAIQYVGGDTCDRPGCCPEPDDEPPFAYTVGLFGMGHPELLVIDVTQATAVAVLNTLGEEVRRGGTVMPGHEFVIDQTHRVVPEVMADPGEFVLRANDFYRQPPGYSVPVLRLAVS